MSSLPEGFKYSQLKDRGYKGDDFKVNQRLGAGPFTERRCTDLACCLFFFLFLGGMAVVTFYGYINGEPMNLVAPIDGDGNICGMTPGYEQYSHLFIGDITAGEKDISNVFDYGICVEACPKTVDASKSLSCKPTAKVTSCTMA